jgi:hypothetical protein
MGYDLYRLQTLFPDLFLDRAPLRWSNIFLIRSAPFLVRERLYIVSKTAVPC